MIQALDTNTMVCMRCNREFTLPEDPGRRTHLLYCVRCGRHKQIGQVDLREYFRQHVVPLFTSNSPASEKKREDVRPILFQKNTDIRKYKYAVEHLAGTCVCGSVFRFSGKPRCPWCRSTAIREGGTRFPSDPAGIIPGEGGRGEA